MRDLHRGFEELAALCPEPAAAKAAPRLKSRIYSRLVEELAAGGALAGLGESKAVGGRLCCFEELVRIAPVGERVKRRNVCRVCHARVLAEHLEKAPIWWPGCPYAEFQD